MLCAEGLRLRRGDFELDASIAAAAGRPVAIVGPSGAGKTTLLRLVAGLERPRIGSVRSADAVWSDAESGTWTPPERRRCAFVFQDYALFEHLPAWRNVAYPVRGSRANRRDRALELLDRFGLAARADARPHELSGGERQRVALARALALEPAALLMDEPLGALDAQTRAAATRELSATIARAGVPAMVVTHDFAEAATLGSEIAVMADGRIVQRGSPGEIAAQPGSPFVADLIGASVLRGAAREDGAIALGAGRVIYSTDPLAVGPAAVSVHPWEVVLEPSGVSASGSARNRLDARVVSITDLGGRLRVGLDVGQSLVAEVTPAAAGELGLGPGAVVQAVWKASATRVVKN